MGTDRTRLGLLCMGFLVVAAVACGDDDSGDEPEGGSGGDGGVTSGRGGGGGAGAGGRGGAGAGGTGGMQQMGFEVTLDGCCTDEGVCGLISELRMACITQSDLLDPPISAGPACDGPDVDADAGADMDAGADDLPPVDPDCPTYTGTYTPAGP